MIAVYALLAVLVLIGWQQFYKKHWLRGIRFRLRFGSESVRAGESVGHGSGGFEEYISQRPDGFLFQHIR